MPRERIALAQKYVVDDEIDGSVSYPFEVQVGWSEGTVQLATRNSEVGEQYDPITGWYVDLNRTEINTLIRMLRRARDSALGADA